MNLENKSEVDRMKLENLNKRQKIYGDITQNASPEDLETLLKYFENHVPSGTIHKSCGQIFGYSCPPFPLVDPFT